MIARVWMRLEIGTMIRIRRRTLHVEVIVALIVIINDGAFSGPVRGGGANSAHCSEIIRSGLSVHVYVFPYQADQACRLACRRHAGMRFEN